MGSLWSAQVGMFSTPLRQHARAAVIVNQDPDAPALLSLTFNVSSMLLWEVSSLHGLTPAVDDAPLLPGIQLRFQAGQGRLLVFD